MMFFPPTTSASTDDGLDSQLLAFDLPPATIFTNEYGDFLASSSMVLLVVFLRRTYSTTRSFILCDSRSPTVLLRPVPTFGPPRIRSMVIHRVCSLLQVLSFPGAGCLPFVFRFFLQIEMVFYIYSYSQQFFFLSVPTLSKTLQRTTKMNYYCGVFTSGQRFLFFVCKNEQPQELGTTITSTANNNDLSPVLFQNVVATICEELSADSVVLLYISASGKASRGIVSLSTSSGTAAKSTEEETHADQQAVDIASDANSVSPMSSPQDSPTTQRPTVQNRGRPSNSSGGGLWLGSRGNGGLNSIYPGDVIPFTRKPLFIIIDSDNSNAFKAGHVNEVDIVEEDVALLGFGHAEVMASSHFSSSKLSCLMARVVVRLMVAYVWFLRSPLGLAFTFLVVIWLASIISGSVLSWCDPVKGSWPSLVASHNRLWKPEWLLSSSPNLLSCIPLKFYHVLGAVELLSACCSFSGSCKSLRFSLFPSVLHFPSPLSISIFSSTLALVLVPRHNPRRRASNSTSIGPQAIASCDLVAIILIRRSPSYQFISGSERGEPAALLLSPTVQPVCANTSSTDSSRYPNNGNLFTFFLTAPLLAFCRLVGLSTSNLGMAAYDQAEKLLSSFLSDWGMILAMSHSLDLVWARILSDPFLRRLILRFIFCRACLALYAPSLNKKECIPECLPRLPDEVLHTSTTVESCVFHLARCLQVVDQFTFSASISISDDMAAGSGQDDCASSESIRNQTSDMTLDSSEVQEEHFVEENGH
eukprot:Gb_34687 [translate_table: standard]